LGRPIVLEGHGSGLSAIVRLTALIDLGQVVRREAEAVVRAPGRAKWCERGLVQIAPFLINAQ
jgi:hypothetical protein